VGTFKGQLSLFDFALSIVSAMTQWEELSSLEAGGNGVKSHRDLVTVNGNLIIIWILNIEGKRIVHSG